MPWFKIDDKHHDHKKTRKALRGVAGKRRDAGAMGLWELAGSWSADNLMDGFVPTDELFRWDDDWENLAQRLCDAGYWEASEHEGEAGYRFINWEEHQPMKADVEAKREAAKERMRNIRSGSRSRSSEVRANLPGSSATPSRPVPSRPVPTNNSAAEEAPKKTASRKRPATALPSDWKPTEQHWEQRHDGIDVDREAQAFRLHAEANDRRQANWNAAFSQWLLRARPNGNVRPIRPTTDDQGRTVLPPLPSSNPWGPA